MKKSITIAFTVLLLANISCVNQKNEKAAPKIISNKTLVKELLELNEGKNYFDMQVKFNTGKAKLSCEHINFFDAILNNVFNNPKASNNAIDEIINSKNTLEDSLLKTLYSKKYNNHERLFEYAKVAKTVSEMRDKFKSSLDSLEDANLENNFNFYNPLKNIPRQELVIESDVTIQMERDKANLLNVETFFLDEKINMIFDTGANISVVRKSYVEKLGMKLIESDFSVGSATGIKVKSELALAEEFKIGDIIIKNAIFMVLKDEDLSFPLPGGYEIYGIIGYPIIEAMKEIHFTKDNQLYIPKNPIEYSLNNMAIDGLIPIIKTIHKGDVMPFQLDTGAQITSLYHPFYKKFESDIVANNEKTKFGSGGAGGAVEYEGYMLNNIQLNIADNEATLNGLRLHIEKIKEDEVELYGNLGQDYITQFDKMILSFEYSSIVFK